MTDKQRAANAARQKRFRERHPDYDRAGNARRNRKYRARRKAQLTNP